MMMEEITLKGATVPFYKSVENEILTYRFDSSKCGHPEPMINAMVGLQQLQNNQRLVMINARSPMGLFPKIEADFSYDVQELENGNFQITFFKKSEDTTIDFNDRGCSGDGGCN